MIKRGSQPLCSVESCGQKYYGRGYCEKHYNRWKTHGDPTVVLTGGRPSLAGYPTFAGLHRRLYRARGRAAEHPCVDCGKRARDWSYKHGDPNEKTQVIGGETVPYSLNLDQYEPRCRACHMKFDRRIPFGKSRQPKTHCKHGHAFDEQNTYVRSDGTRSCKTCQAERGRRSKQTPAVLNRGGRCANIRRPFHPRNPSIPGRETSVFDKTGTYRILKLTIPGQPIPKGRPRFGRSRTFTPKRTISAEAGIAAEFHRNLGVRHTLETPVTGKLHVRVRFFRKDHTRVDLDNLLKLPLDALNGLAWVDDNQIISLIGSKHYDKENPRTEIDVFTAAGA